MNLSYLRQIEIEDIIKALVIFTVVMTVGITMLPPTLTTLLILVFSGGTAGIGIYLFFRARERAKVEKERHRLR